MQQFLDFLPIIVWFIAYRLYGMYVATGVIIVAMALLIGFQWLRHRKVSKMLLASGVLVLLLGGVTLVFRNPTFFQWKVTVANWLFAAVFLGSRYVGDKTITERMMGHAVELDENTWRQLNVIWVLSFFVLGAVNLYVLYNFDENTWAYFKLFGSLGILLLTAIGQAIWISLRLSQQSRDDPNRGSS